MARLLVLGLFLVVVGCSDRASDMPELGTVHGTVTLDGKPLPNVSIYFKPETGRQSIARANAEGYYEAMYLIDEEGVKVGPCTAMVEWGIDDSGPPIPPRYGAKSELTFNVEAGDNTFDIEMTSN
ncbi:MAG: hypothetical protein R3C59_13215 [Planctomycetaceae bacterium]